MAASDQSRADVLVLGAGIVGLSVALHLARRGKRVAVVDAGRPGAGTSYGNSGVVTRDSILPLSGPAMLRDLPAYALNRTPRLHLSWPALPELAPWLARFLAAGRPAAFARGVAALDALMRLAAGEHESLAAEADTGHLLHRDGWLHLYRTAESVGAHAAEHALWRDYGVPFEPLAAADIARLEPHLKPAFAGGAWLTGGLSTPDPGGLCAGLAAHAAARGVRFVTADARTIAIGEGGVHLTAGDATLRADRAVICLGPWSRQVTDRFGYRPPLIAHRGYHVHVPPRGNAGLTRPVYDVDHGYVMAPMRAGIRVTSGIELARKGAAPNPVQLARAVEQARQVLDLGAEVEATPWMGRRPATPDSLPVIGPVPGVPRLWAAFGHGSIGLTAGPVTGRLVAELMGGESPCADPEPYSPDRF